MKKIFTTLTFIILISVGSFAQNILIQNDFTGYNGLPSTVAPGWYYSWNDSSSASRSYYTTAGTCGLAVPAYKFGKDSVTIITPAFAGADSVSFFLKGNGTAHDSNTIYIYSSPDSIVWNPIWSMDSVTITATHVSVPLSSSDTHLKFFYRKIVSGFNVGVDDILVFNNIVGIKPVEKFAASIYPNPSKGIVNFDFNVSQLKNATVIVSNILGNELKRIALNSSDTNYRLDLSEFQDGIYFVKVKSDSGDYLQRIILKK